MTAKPTRIRDNLTRREIQALKKLRKRTDIVIKPADKGSGTVVMDRQLYLNECYRQLNNQQFYKREKKDPTDHITERVKKYLKGLLKDNIINKETHRYLTPQDPKAGRFYILPKIHKPGNPGRPIVSANGHPTEKQTLPCTILVTLDVSSLYTNIPTNEGINACRRVLDQRTDKSIPTEKLCDLMRIILTMNNFVFNGEHFIQQHGIAMGTRMAPAFANLFMGDFERKALEGYTDKPLLWFRYIDNILKFWTHGNEKLDDFIAYLNSIHPTIKFTSERSTTSIPFLDVNIQLENGKIETDLHCKPTAKHQYLLYSSSHPYHTKKSIPYSLALRLRRICSKDEFFECRSKELQTYLTKRGYKNRFVKSQISRAKLIPREDTLKEHLHEIKEPSRVPFILTYNPALPNINKILRKKQTISIPQNAYTKSTKNHLL
ncbi:hypothetical protein ACROYT_G003426 [Oculina patagonica]